MATINLLQEMQLVATASIQIITEEAELAAGVPVSGKPFQIGTLKGEPVMATLTLTLGNPTVAPSIG